MGEIMTEKAQFGNDGSFSSISQARSAARNYENKLRNQEIVELTEAYEGLTRTIEQNNIKLNKAQIGYKNQIIETKKAIEDMLKENNIDFKESHDKMEQYIKDLQRLLDKLVISDGIDDSVRNRIRNYREMVFSVQKDLDEDMKTYKESSKSMFDALGKSFKNLKDDIRDLSLVSATANIEKGLGLNKTYNAYNSMRTNFGMSAKEYSNFTLGLAKQNFSQGSVWNLSSKYNFDDAVEYMSKLSELGINNEKQAKEMFNVVTLGTKYLGMTTETQAKILDISRRTGDLDLLNKTNQTQVQIMNAQLGISKEHLNATLAQSASMANLSTMFSGNNEALLNFQKEASAITSVYGEDTALSAQNIAQDVLANTYNSKYLGILGGDFNNILGMLQRGETGALEAIIQASKRSSLSGTAASNAYARTAIEEAGIGYDNNVMTLYNSTAKDGKSVKGELGKINSASNDTNKFLKDIKTGLTEKLGNLASWIQAAIPLQNLQTVYYTMAIAEMTANAARGILNFGNDVVKFFKNGNSAFDILKNVGKEGGIKGIFNLLRGNLPQSTESLAALSKSSSATSLATSNLSAGLLQYGGGAALIAAGVMKGIHDAKEATKKADEWGVSKTSAGIGGFLGGSSDDVMTRIFGKAIQYGAIGAGIGTMIYPGIGTAIGAVIGILAGVLMGAIGGKSFAKSIDSFGEGFSSLFGGSSAEGGPALGGPAVTEYKGGRGGSIEDALKGMIHSPWYSITSMFGNRPNPFGGNGSENHGGMDIAAPRGTPIGSAVSGTVDYTYGGGTGDNDGSGGGFGNHVVIRGDNGIYYVYGHMNSAPSVKAGQKVAAGQAIGVVGSTGRSTGPHLHFQTGSSRYGGKFDPSPYLTTGVLYPGSGSIRGLSAAGIEAQALEFKDSTQLLQRIISQDTKGGRGGPSDSQGIIDSVDNGFQSLMNKLEELSGRQDQQEEVMKALVSGSSSKLYKI